MCRAEVTVAGLTGQTACARTPSWVSPLGSCSPFRPSPEAQGSEGFGRRSAALGIRLPGGATRATRSSPRFLPLCLSQDGAGADPEDGLRVGLGRGAQSYRASVEGQPTGCRGRVPNTFSVDRAAGAAGPTISSGLKERPRLSDSVQPQVPKPRQCASAPPRLIELPALK